MIQGELRVGNWVEKKGKQYQLSAIGIFAVGKEHRSILLTEEWFLRFGFCKVGKYFVWSNLDIDFCFNYRDFKEDYTLRVEYTDSPSECDQGQKYPITFSVKYVHQLQNLMYWVTLGIGQVDLK